MSGAQTGTRRVAAALPQGRVERRKEKTRQVLLQVALGLFFEKGIYWTKIEDITERADVGKGTFYQYFETKEALLRALLQQGLDLVLARTQDALRDLKPGPEAVSRMVLARLDFFLENPEYLLLFHQVRGLLQLKVEAVKELRQAYEAHFDRLGAILRAALNGRPPSPWKARDLALALSAFTSGLLVHHLLFDKGDFKHRREVIQAQLDRSLQALL